MANLTAYGTGTPKASDLLLGTKTATPNTNEKNITQNFTVSDVAAFANSYSLGYTVYTAALLQTGTSAPVATVLQNTTGGTFTWLYADVGKSQIAVSGITLPANKVAIFMSSSTGNLGLGGKITTTTQIDVEQFSSGGGGYANGMSAGTSIEIRIYI
jgi:hypothetical protein